MANKVFERAGGNPCQADFRWNFVALTSLGAIYCGAGGDPATDTDPDQDQFCSFWTEAWNKPDIPSGLKECADIWLEYFGDTHSDLPSECDSSESF